MLDDPTHDLLPDDTLTDDTSTDDTSIPRPRLSRRTGEALPPPELRALARERSEARRAQDWEEADRLRALIEAQGWKVVDKGAEGRVVRAHAEDEVEDDGAIRYGWTGAVPEFEGSRASGIATIVARATADPTDVVRLRSRLTGAPAGTHLLIVADRHARLPDDVGAAEVIRIGETATAGVMLTVALRRARGEFVVVGEGWPAEASAERIPAVLGQLADPAVGVAGWWGVVSSDLRHLSPVPAAGEPIAVAWAGMTFRTADGLARGPIDEAFQDPALLAAWWSLVLRDEYDEDDASTGEAPPRTARALLDATNMGESTAAQDRAVRRDRYRVMDRFGRRTDLLTAPNATDRSPAPPR